MNQNYKDTINLPRTHFPMRGDLPRREPVWLAQWEKAGLYRKIQQCTADRDRVFILHDGPPYANGALHIGHALNKILKEMVVRSKWLAGYHAPYVPGWDCHGLPIEMVVEKKFGKPGEKFDVRAFRQKCREYAAQQVELQRTGFKRLGILGDWENPYCTKDFRYEADILRALAKIFAHGHVIRGAKPVHWCFDCGSALAEAEIEYSHHCSLAVDVAYTVVDKAALADRFAVRAGDATMMVPIWTTTPWTLPESQAVALGTRLDYALVEAIGRDGRHVHLVIAAGLVDSVLGRYGMEPTRVLAHATGKSLVGVLLHHPFYARIVPLVSGDHVSAEEGTGAVHTSPDHGVEDFVIGRENGLGLLGYVGARGVYHADTPPAGDLELAGLHVWKANALIVALLDDHNTLLAQANIEHSYPHCWRHKTPVIFRATPQWFISMEQADLRTRALTAIDDVCWVPDWGRKRIATMVAGRPDWCISRQRIWGVPIALFVHKRNQKPHPDSVALLERVAEKVERNGIDAWYDLSPDELLGEPAQDYDKVTDVLDVWFDSGVTHFAVMAKRPELQVGRARQYEVMYLEGSDQHRGWFQSSLLTSCAIHGHAPYKTVLTHGFTVDAAGRKMSKSLGNVVDLQKATTTLGADVVRLWVASVDYRGEVSVSDEILKRVSDSYRRIRNTVRFLLGNLDGFDPARHQIEVRDMPALDQWVVQQAYDLQQAVIAAYARYDFPEVVARVQHFCVNELSALYLDITKDRLYTMPIDSHGRRSAQSAMFHLVEALVRWLAPVLAFTAEEIWQALPGKREESVLMDTWYEDLVSVQSSSERRRWWCDLLVMRDTAARVLEAMRQTGRIGAALDADLTIHADTATLARYAHAANELRFFFITSDVRFANVDDRPVQAVRVEQDGMEAWIWATVSKAARCVRCWHRRDDVGEHARHRQLCGRCVTNVDGPGETRRWF